MKKVSEVTRGGDLVSEIWINEKTGLYFACCPVWGEPLDDDFKTKGQAEWDGLREIDRYESGACIYGGDFSSQQEKRAFRQGK